MAREYSKTNVTIWQDDDWCALPFPAQHIYRMLWDHPLLTYCGVVDWRPAKLSAWSAGLDRDLIKQFTDCLQARHFIVVDEDTEECLVRSWVRWDGLIRQPRLAVSFANAYAAVASRTLRGVVIHEMKKLKDREPEATGWAKPSVQAMFDLPDIDAKSLDVPEDPFADGFVFALGSVSSEVSEAFGRNPAKGLGSVSVPPTPAPAPTPYNSSSSEIALAVSGAADAAPDEGRREDVEILCSRLAGAIEANGVRRPNITKRWRDAARLLIDKDGYTVAQVAWLIDKATADEFWRSNILSMPTLREKADQLKLKFVPPQQSNVRYLADGQVDPTSLPPLQESWMRQRNF